MALEPPTPLHDLTDETLVERYRRDGVEEAFAELVRRYQQELFHFVLRFVGRRNLADEVFQEVFLQVHLSADTFDTSRKFKPWLFTIAANKARDHLRRNSRRQAIPLSALTAGDGDDERSIVDLLAADVVLPEEIAGRKELQAIVQEVVSELPEHLREVLLLAYFQRLAYKEIAEMLSIPLGTVKSRLHSAVGTFARQWKQRYAAYHEEEI